MTYGLSFLKHLEFLQSRGITDVIWIQDDEFTTHANLDDYKDFLEFYRSRPDINHVSLSVHKERLSVGINGPSNDDIGERINDNLTIYKTNCKDFYNFTLEEVIKKLEKQLKICYEIRNKNIK